MEENRAKLLEVYGLQKNTIEEQQKEIGRLRVRNDAWYEREPWLVFALGAMAGGLAYGLLRK